MKDDNEILNSPIKNNIIDEEVITPHSYKESLNGKMENEIESEFLNESRETDYNSRNLLDDENEEYSANLNSDKPSKIIDFQEINGVICFHVVWQMRSNGINPKNSFVKNDHFREKFPKFSSDFLKKFNFD